MTTTTEEKPAPPPGLEVHVYDGIEEHDNRLPRWWLMTLWGAVVFAFGYWMWFQTFSVGVSPRAAFDQEMLARQVQATVAAAQAGVVNDDVIARLSQDPAAVERGRVVYTSTCQACHADKGQGLVGPNLTDDAWLHGDRPTQILAIIDGGVIAKGMPGWGPALGVEKTKDVAAFLLTLKGTNIPGKEPQGIVVVK